MAIGGVPQSASGTITLEDGGVFAAEEMIAAHFRDGEYIYSFRGILGQTPAFAKTTEAQDAAEAGQPAPAPVSTPFAPAEQPAAPTELTPEDVDRLVRQAVADALEAERAKSEPATAAAGAAIADAPSSEPSSPDQAEPAAAPEA